MTYGAPNDDYCCCWWRSMMGVCIRDSHWHTRARTKRACGMPVRTSFRGHCVLIPSPHKRIQLHHWMYKLILYKSTKPGSNGWKKLGASHHCPLSISMPQKHRKRISYHSPCRPAFRSGNDMDVMNKSHECCFFKITPEISPEHHDVDSEHPAAKFTSASQIRDACIRWQQLTFLYLELCSGAGEEVYNRALLALHEWG